MRVIKIHKMSNLQQKSWYDNRISYEEVSQY
jgi:hypothetical protein